MALIMDGCRGNKGVQIFEKKCPRCGHEIEIFSVDTDAVCENCGFKIYNDALNCVQWCQYARKCVGDEMYEHVMAVAAEQKRRREEERAAKEQARG